MLLCCYLGDAAGDALMYIVLVLVSRIGDFCRINIHGQFCQKKTQAISLFSIKA
jgi:hypothetical protein